MATNQYFYRTFYPIMNYDYDYTRDVYKFVTVNMEELGTQVIEYYTVRQNDTVYSISLDLYGSQDYWWVLAVINGITDIFDDFPKTQKTIYRDVIKDNGSYSNPIYDEKVTANDAKRRIIVLKKEFLESFIADFSKKMGLNV